MKFMSAGEAETKRQKAIEFLERVGGDANKFRQMSAAEYASSKGAELLDNPSKRKLTMTKTEMAETLDQVEDGLSEALDPQLSREELVAKVMELQELVSGDADESDEDESDED
jgi:hypothetical protein